ncbi:MAG: hypothetical protein ACK5IC_07900 [Moheibacter sp.]
MREIIIYVVLSGLVFLFILYGLFMLFFRKKKAFKTPVILSFLLFIGLCGFTVYKTVAKTYNKVVNETDELLISGASKVGEVTGESVTSFGESVVDGTENTYRNKTIVSDDLKEEGLTVGEVLVESKNELNVYFVFNEIFKDSIIVRVINENNLEIGRTLLEIEGKKNDAKYIPIKFSPETNIGEQSKIIVEDF